MKIKYIALCLLLVLVGCQRDEEMEVTQLTISNERIEPSCSSVTISCDITSNVTIKQAKVYVSESTDFSAAKTQVLNKKSGNTYSAEIDGLADGATYYVRYQISNRWVSLMAEEISEFQTIPATKPTVTTTQPKEITHNNAIIGGKIVDNGGLTVTNCGVMYSKSPNPTIENGTKVESNIIKEAYTCTLTNLDFATTYYARAYAINKKGTAYGEQVTFTTTELKDGEGIENGYIYVDLGLSVKWATMNVGASGPEDYGDYFAWGETSTQSTYNWSTYKYCNGSYDSLTKYNTNSSYGTIDNITQLDLSDDAARANWGGSWRMPTDAEMTELRSNCTWTWTTQNDVNGYKVTSKSNGNSIFLPAAGFRSSSSLYDPGSSGLYWSSSLYTDSPDYAWYVYFNSSIVNNRAYTSRYHGRSVRPVCP